MGGIEQIAGCPSTVDSISFAIALAIVSARQE